MPRMPPVPADSRSLAPSFLLNGMLFERVVPSTLAHVEQPTDKAKALDLEVPPTLLARAD
jgi:hypothetical protein